MNDNELNRQFLTEAQMIYTYMKKMLIIFIHQGNQNCVEIPSHPSLSAQFYHPSAYHQENTQQMLVRMWGKENQPTVQYGCKFVIGM
jgi:hypothetical protein